MPEDRLPEPGHELRGARRRIRLAVERAHGAHHHLEGCFHLAAIRRRRKKLLTRHNRPQHLANVAISRRKNRRRAIHQRWARRITHKMARQFEGDVMRGARMARDNVEHLLAILDAAAGGERMAQHHFLAGVVHQRHKVEATLCLAGALQCPAGQRARHIDHIGLCVAAIHAQGVQFEQLTPVVLIESGPSAGWSGSNRLLPASPSGRARLQCTNLRGRERGESATGHHKSRTCTVGLALPVIQVEEHRGALGHRAKEVAELPERMRANRLGLVFGQVIPRLRPLGGVHREVIEPEIDHHFLQLALASGGARHPRAVHFAHELTAGFECLFIVGAVGGGGLAPLGAGGHFLLQHAGRGNHPLQLGGVDLQQLVVLVHKPLGGGVVNPVRVQLEVDPPVHPHFTDARDVTRACSEGEPAQDM